MTRFLQMRRPGFALITCLCLAGASVRAQSPYSSVERASVATGGTEGDLGAAEPDFSANARYLAFSSGASTLVPGDINGAYDVFVRDRLLARTELISVDTFGARGNSSSYSPSISADARYVAFVSYSSNLVVGDTNNCEDVFLRDRLLGTTTRVSLAPGGVQLNALVYEAKLSSDGNLLAFSTIASNLGFIDQNNDFDTYVRDLQTGQVELITIALNGETGNEGGDNPHFSGDGRLVSFDSNSTDIIANKTVNFSDVFVRDRQLGTTVRASTTPVGAEADSESYESQISANGRYVAFKTYASNLVAGTNPSVSALVRKDLVTGATLHVSEGVAGSMPDDESYLASFSQDGRFVAFASLSTNLVTGDTNGVADVFVRDTLTGTTERRSLTSTGAQSGPNAYVLNVELSPDASVIAWTDTADDLIPGDLNGVEDVFVRDGARNYSLLCQGKLNSMACMPVLLASGNTSATSAAPFLINTSSLINNKQGLFIYGLAPSAAAFQGGTLCILPPIVRLPPVLTGGHPPPNDCSGVMAVDFKPVIQSGSNPALVAGQLVYVQGYYRDGQSSPWASGLTSSVEFEILP